MPTDRRIRQVDDRARDGVEGARIGRAVERGRHASELGLERTVDCSHARAQLAVRVGIEQVVGPQRQQEPGVVAMLARESDHRSGHRHAGVDRVGGVRGLQGTGLEALKRS